LKKSASFCQMSKKASGSRCENSPSFWGQAPPNDLQMPETPPLLEADETAALTAYRKNARALTDLENQLARMQQDAELSRLGSIPDIQAGAFVGNTQVNDCQGSNYGVSSASPIVLAVAKTKPSLS